MRSELDLDLVEVGKGVIEYRLLALSLTLLPLRGHLLLLLGYDLLLLRRRKGHQKPWLHLLLRWLNRSTREDVTGTYWRTERHLRALRNGWIAKNTVRTVHSSRADSNGLVQHRRRRWTLLLLRLMWRSLFQSLTLHLIAVPTAFFLFDVDLPLFACSVLTAFWRGWLAGGLCQTRQREAGRLIRAVLLLWM